MSCKNCEIHKNASCSMCKYFSKQGCEKGIIKDKQKNNCFICLDIDECYATQKSTIKTK